MILVMIGYETGKKSFKSSNYVICIQIVLVMRLSSSTDSPNVYKECNEKKRIGRLLERKSDRQIQAVATKAPTQTHSIIIIPDLLIEFMRSTCV